VKITNLLKKLIFITYHCFIVLYRYKNSRKSLPYAAEFQTIPTSFFVRTASPSVVCEYRAWPAAHGVFTVPPSFSAVHSTVF